MNEPLEFDIVADKMQSIIKVIGVGGGGGNAVRNMYNEGIAGVSFAVCNTDSQALSKLNVPVKLVLGEGLGAGGDAAKGRAEAEKSIDEIEKLFQDGIKMVFITASMGGGTGTGVAPVVAGVAHKMGILTVGVVTIPFYFEKRSKIVMALRGMEELRKNVDALLIINNERICDVYEDSELTLKQALGLADNILKDAVKGISELITIHSEGDINLDFRDVEAVTRNGGGALMGVGKSSGKNRVEKAIINALDSPLLYGNDIGKASRILFNIYTSNEKPLTVNELREISNFFARLDANVNVIWGTSTDDSLGDEAKVIILATGMEMNTLDSSLSEEEKDDAYYEQLVRKLYRPSTKPLEEPVPEPTFTVEAAPDPERASIPEPEEEKPAATPLLKERLKDWLMGMMEAE